MMNGPNPRTGDKEEEASSSRTAVIENAFPVAMLISICLGGCRRIIYSVLLQAYHWTLETASKIPNAFLASS